MSALADRTIDRIATADELSLMDCMSAITKIQALFLNGIISADELVNQVIDVQKNMDHCVIAYLDLKDEVRRINEQQGTIIA